MQIVNYPVPCECCGEVTTLQVNLFTGEHKTLTKIKTNGRDMWHLVETYKKIKGYDTMPTWDKINRPRHMAAAKKILIFFAPLEDPIGIAKECMAETDERAKKEGWSWTLETILKIADRWLLEKQK